MKYIPCKGRRIGNISEYEVMHKGNKGIMAVCDACLNMNLTHNHCKTCSGKIVMLVEQVFDANTDDFINKTTIKTDSFEVVNGKFIQKEYATELQKECFIIREIYLDESLQIDKSGGKLRAYDRPTNWKTACLDCKDRFDIPECQRKTNPEFSHLCTRQKQTVKWV